MVIWINYYTNNERDIRHFEYIFNKSHQDLAALCMGHLEDDAHHQR
jgi:succinate dehydrogenase flavin-adding protein (antitoxin of CptAB toxin-antitoxin module)